MPVSTRERVLAALGHEVTDRTPARGGFHPESRRKLLEHFKTGKWEDVEEALGIGGWEELSARVDDPQFAERAEERTVGMLTRKGLWEDERTYVDKWGVTFRVGESGWYEERVRGPLDEVDGEDLDAARNVKLPTFENLNVPESYAARVAGFKARGCFTTGEIRNPYKDAWLLRGIDNVLADYLIHRDFLEILYDRLYALYTEIARIEVRAGVDMITLWGDIAMQDRVIMGPETWREVDKPRMAELVAAIKKENPEVYMFIHSDGDVFEVIDDLVEIGFDVINPIQPECVDPAEIKKRWGDKITMCGGLSLQQTLPGGTPAEVREEVLDLIRKCGYDGGLIVAPSNSVQPDVPVENILACYKAIRDLDPASLGGRPG